MTPPTVTSTVSRVLIISTGQTEVHSLHWSHGLSWQSGSGSRAAEVITVPRVTAEPNPGVNRLPLQPMRPSPAARAP